MKHLSTVLRNLQNVLHQNQTSKSFLFVIILLSFFPFETYSQVEGVTESAKSSTVSSPGASSLASQSNVPVNLYNGTAQISVPLYQLKGDMVSLPVGLTYNTSGVKVGQMASSVGLGWSLIAGGVITRTVNDIPDDCFRYYTNGPFGVGDQWDPTENTGYLYYPSRVDQLRDVDISQMTEDELLEWQTKSSELDYEPDLFSFNFNGYAGTFVFGTDYKAKVFSQQDIKIDYVLNQDLKPEEEYNAGGVSPIRGGIESFTITTPDGTQYIFDEREVSFMKSHRGEGLGSTSGGVRECNPNVPDPYSLSFDYRNADAPAMGYFSSWYLSEVINPLGNLEFSLSYDTEVITDNSAASISKNRNIYENAEDPEDNVMCTGASLDYETYAYFTEILVITKRINEIVSENGGGKIIFRTSGGVREDVYYPNSSFIDYRSDLSKAKAISSIEWRNNNGVGIKDYVLNYSMFEPIEYPEECLVGISYIWVCEHDETISCPPGTEQCNCIEIIDPDSYSEPEDWVLAQSKRLRLDNIVERGWGTYGPNVELPPVEFEYNSTVLRPRHSPHQDFWGYYNGGTDVQYREWRPKLYIYPEDLETNDKYQTMYSVFERPPGFLGEEIIIEGANRDCNEEAMQAGILTRINYPTGGYSEYFYGAHEFDFEGTTIEGGGLRIEEIVVSDGNGGTNLREFKYTEEDGTPSGKLLNFPIYSYWGANGCYYFCEAENGVSIDYIKDNTLWFTNNANFSGISNSIPVAYSQAIEDLDGYGKNIYTYNLNAYVGVEEAPVIPSSNEMVYHRSISEDDVSSEDDDDHDPFPLNPNFEWSNGLLLESKILDESNEVVQRSTNTYQLFDYESTSSVKFKAMNDPYEYPVGVPNVGHVIIGKTNFLSGDVRLVESETVYYGENNQSMSQVQTIEYNGVDHRNPTATQTTNSDGKVHRTEMRYPTDINSGTAIQDLIDNYRIAMPLERIKFVDGVEVGRSETYYGFVYGSTGPVGYINMPKVIRHTDANNNWVTDAELNYYYPSGKLKLKSNPNFPTSTKYIWGASPGLLNEEQLLVNGTIKWSSNYEYNDTYSLTRKTDINGVITDYTYDGLQRLKTTTARSGTSGEAISTNTYAVGPTAGNYISTFTDYGNPETNNTETQEVIKYFDGLGRPKKTVGIGHTPTGGDLTSGLVVYNSQGLVYAQSDPVSGITWSNYETSPLNRVKSVTNGMTSTFYRYEVNSATIVNHNGSNYSPGTLYKNTVIDGHGNASTSYKDKLGRVVMTRNAEGGETYSSYDDYGNLVAVIPPGADGPNHVASYRYEYDHRHRLVEKHIPGAEYVQYWYNTLDRLYLTQDGNQRGNDRGIYYEYDDLGREIRTSLVDVPFSLPISGEILTETSYDVGSGGTSSGASLGKVTMTKTKKPQDSQFYITEMVYDGFGRLVSALSDNYLGGTDFVVTDYDNADKINFVTRTHIDGDGNETVIVDRSEYDNAGRQKRAFHKIGDGPERRVSHLNYYENDLIKQRNLGRTFDLLDPFLQSIDYRYNGLGWLTDINNVPTESSGIAIPTCDEVSTIPCTERPTNPCTNGGGTQSQSRLIGLNDALGMRMMGNDIILGCDPDCEETSERCDYTVSFDISLFDQIDSIVAGGAVIPLPGYPYTNGVPSYVFLENNIAHWLEYNGYAVDSVSRGYDGRNMTLTIYQTDLIFESMYGIDNHNGIQLNRESFTKSNCTTPETNEGRLCNYGLSAPANSVESNRLFATHYGDESYADLILDNTGAMHSLVVDGISWHISRVGGREQTRGETSWDVGYELSDLGVNSVTSYSVGVDVADVLLSTGLARFGLHDGNGFITMNNGQQFVDATESGLLVLTPDQLPTSAQIKEMKVALLFEEGRYIDIDGLTLSLNYEKDCGDSRPCGPTVEDICEESVMSGGEAPILRLKEQMYQTRMEDIKFPTTLNRIKLCDESELYVLQQELYAYDGDYAVLYVLPLTTADDQVNLDLGDIDDDLFSESIRYNNPHRDMNAQGQVNGNISSVKWHVKGQTNKGYGYRYDVMNRLTQAHYAEFFGEDGECSVSTDGRYSVRDITYDLRGNIMTLSRNGVTNYNTTTDCYDFGLIDNLSYIYNDQKSETGNGNSLVSVSDGGSSLHGFIEEGSANDEYTYDANGNLTRDLNKGIQEIIYGLFNVPTSVVKTNGDRIDWTYDYGGNLLKMTVIQGTNYHSRIYQGGIEYVQSGSLGNTPPPVIESVMHSEGRAVRNEQGGYVYEYVLTDHLGNARIRFADLDNDGSIDTPTASSDYTEILQEIHYYPFGLKQEGPWSPTAAPTSRYQYNGIEHLAELGLNLNFALFRTLDPSIGRWWQVDPEAENYYNLSPYNSMGNNPITIIDPNGDSLIGAVLIGAAIGAYAGYKVGDAKGATGWSMAGYIAGGALVGGISGGVGSAITTSGIAFANTAAIIGGSFANSLGMAMVSGGDTGLSVSFGFGSYDMFSGDFGYLGKDGNSKLENWGYGLGSMANIQDAFAGRRMGGSVDVKSRAKLAGHSAVEGTDINISVGPEGTFNNKPPDAGGLKWELQYLYKSDKGRNFVTTWKKGETFTTTLNNVNTSRLEQMTLYLNNGLSLSGNHTLKYGVYHGCVNQSARALFRAGVLNANALLPITAPVLLNAELALRNYGMMFSYQMTTQ